MQMQMQIRIAGLHVKCSRLVSCLFLIVVRKGGNQPAAFFSVTSVKNYIRREL